MIIDVKAKNERLFVPDFMTNLKEDSDKQFSIKVKKLNQTLHSNRWSKLSSGEDDEINITMDYIARVKAHVIGFVNAPMLKVSENESKELTIDILLSEDYEILYPIVEQLNSYINDMYKVEDKELEKK